MKNGSKVSLFTHLTHDEQASLTGGQCNVCSCEVVSSASGGKGGDGQSGAPGQPGAPGRTIVCQAQGNQLSEADRAVLDQTLTGLSALF